MRSFRKLYDTILGWSKHPKAPGYLAVVSFFEASCFPFPPDFMLAPMALSKPEKAWSYAFIAVVASVIGGLFGYALGFYVFEPIIKPIITHLGYMSTFEKGMSWLKSYGVWTLIISGFTPLPFKIFTIASGLAHFALLKFIYASILGRSLRFYLLAGAVKFGGKKISNYLIKYLDLVGWAIIVSIIAVFIYYVYF